MNKLLEQDEEHILSVGFVGITGQQRKDETLMFQDVTSSRAKSLSSLHPAMAQLTYTSSSMFSFSPATAWKLEGNPEFEGSEGTQKWCRIAATQSDPMSLGLDAQHWPTWELPLCVCSTKPM